MTDMELDLEYEEMEFVAADERRYIVLVIYDIVDNKRRNRMVKCAEVRLRGVFEQEEVRAAR